MALAAELPEAGRSLDTLDVRVLRSIPTPVADVLQTHGCRTAGDVLSQPKALHQALDLLHVPQADLRADRLLGACRREVADAWDSADSALALLQQGQEVAPLVLPCQQLGGLLGNALRPGAGILEVCGLPGTGKTQLCMQVCAVAQLPACLPAGSDAPEAVFIDAEGSFVASRYAQICQALLAERRPGAGPRDLEFMLRKMHVCRTYDATELFATLKQMEQFLQAHRGVRALVVDSMAFYFRHEFADNQPQKARILMDIATMLRRYGAEHQLSIIVTNHMTTRFDRSMDEASDNGWLVPALGETWAHQPSTQLRLERLSAGSFSSTPSGQPVVASPVHPLGKATLTKSVEQAVGRSCAYRITEGGLRDAD